MGARAGPPGVDGRDNAHVPMGCEGFANMFSEASGSSFGRSLQSKFYSHDGAQAKFFLSSHKETTSLKVARVCRVRCGP